MKFRSKLRNAALTAAAFFGRFGDDLKPSEFHDGQAIKGVHLVGTGKRKGRTKKQRVSHKMHRRSFILGRPATRRVWA